MKILEGVIRRAESLGCQGCTPDDTIRLHYSSMGYATPQTELGRGLGPRLLHRWLRLGLHQSMQSVGDDLRAYPTENVFGMKLRAM